MTGEDRDGDGNGNGTTEQRDKDTNNEESGRPPQNHPEPNDSLKKLRILTDGSQEASLREHMQLR
jgi:hypothetical protein